MPSKSSRTSSDLPKKRLVELTGALTEHICNSLLPGDTPFDTASVDEAARFVIDTASVRKPGEAAIRIESRSEQRRYMRIAIVNDDMPFLVDSVALTVAREGLSIDRLVHPVLPVRRDADGVLQEIPAARASGEAQESMIYLETARVDAKQRRDLERALAVTLADNRAAVSDWPRMQEVLAEDAARLADAEGAALLRWLNDGNFTLLGHVTRKRDGSQSQVLGVCRKSAKQILADASCERAFAWFDDPGSETGRAPLIVKANRHSNVHRHVPLDLFVVPRMAGGTIEAISIHAGTWTSAALATPAAEVPRLRTQMAELGRKFGFDPGGHAGKALAHALHVLPHDLIIGFSDRDVERVVATMMSLQDRPRPRLALVEAPLSRHLFAFVWIPRDMLSTQVRLGIQDMLVEASDAAVLDWSLEVEGGSLAMIRFVLDIRDGAKAPDAQALETRLQAMLRGWVEAVETELGKTEEPARAAALAARYADAFPTSYRTAYGPEQAARDIERLRRLGAEDADADAPLRGARLYRGPSDPEGHLRLKVYQSRGALPLSDAVPALENFGLRVMAEIPTALGEGALGTIHDFTVAPAEGSAIEPMLERAEVIEDAVAAVLNGLAEDDSFNRLVTGTMLGAREAELLRAFYRYLRQTGMGFTIYTVVDALERAGEITRALVALFTALHDPDFGGDREKAVERQRETIKRGLAGVAAINDDRLLRLYNAVIDAILRTNAFAVDPGEALAFKIDSAQVPGLPRPVPWREIFVYSRRVEGIHLRAGPVARGGIRWSDRRDDFRTEVLGLMKAQRVKNAVIVPTGAKGGFYPKSLPDPGRDRESWAAEGQASYEIFIRSLLSITDNIVKNEVVHPEGVRVHDGEDPYFVVAADKGTARFSDVANAIAIERDFWLDDAFASGGSNGYDHKAMGITARGAWVSVQRHFREMGVDVQTDPVRVAGCGDMSGDVFGNGMLLSKTIRLVAAFDHRHIFIDPDPDPAASWQERQRLFELPRSSWADYDEALISKGGGVWPRTMKRIPVSKAAQQALGIEAKELEPDALIAAILAAPVDLLWFGGIGTYVKATGENHVEVGDPANDALRIDGAQVRAKVIGEGANLGITQAGRIEFALDGGRINTDFIDNSAGVNCSDNEVNIKIALAPARRSGDLSDAERAKLLRRMTDDVAAIVLEDNRLQALALSIAEQGGATALASQARLMETLEDTGALDRRTEGLADGETLARRASDGAGLTRPELAVLLSSTKLLLQDAIEASDLPADPILEEDLVASFPAPMRKEYRECILSHRLRGEILATEIANRIVNRLGLVHPFELAEEEGTSLESVAAAFVVADKLFDLWKTWRALDEAEISEKARLLLFDRAAVAVRIQMADLLRAGAGNRPPSELVAELAPGIAELDSATRSLLAGESRQHSERMHARLVEAGATEELAAMVVHLFDMDGATGLARLAQRTGIATRSLTEAFTALGSRLRLDWAQGTAAVMNPSDVWERLLVAGLARDFQQMRFQFLGRLARQKNGKTDPSAAVEDWAQRHEGPVRQFRAMVGRAQAQTPVAPAMLAQIASQARNLLSR